MKISMRGIFGEINSVLILAINCGSILCQQSMIINTFSESIGNTILECKDETHFGHKILNEFLSFWDPKYVLHSRGVGCVVLCATSRLELFDDNGNVIKANFLAFGKSIGSDDNTTKKLISLLNLCKSIVQEMKNECDTLFEMTKCFRYGIFQLHWAPEHPTTE